MSRDVITACLPCLAALAVSFAALVALARGSGARFDWARLRRLHDCESGGVQSLAFVLTLPAFTMLVLFIVQVSQLMVGVMVVHYAAYAAARSAAVWLPADIGDSMVERENVIDAVVEQEGDYLRVFQQGANPESVKFRRIRAAAVLACAAIAPSRTLQSNEPLPQWVQDAQQAAPKVYLSMVPSAANNARITPRLQNKLAYSYHATEVTLEWMEVPHPGKDVDVGPTYNPRGHPDPAVSQFHWNRQEIGWEDPITIWVKHKFALLPGPGRFLARHLVPASGAPDNVSGRINENESQFSETVHQTEISASAQMTAEGFKSVQPNIYFP